MSEKSKAALLKDKLFANAKNGGLVCDENDIEKAYQFAEGYKTFLDIGKTAAPAVDGSGPPAS